MVRRRAALCLLALAGAGGCAAPGPSATYEILRVIDGDTIVVALPTALGVEETGVRLLYVDAYELRDPSGCGVAARDALAGLLPPGSRVRLSTPDRRRRDSFGRVLAVVEGESGVVVNEWIVGQGLARPRDW